MQNIFIPVVAQIQHWALWSTNLISSLRYIVLMPVQDSVEWNPTLFNRSPPPRHFPHLLLRTALPSVSLCEHGFTDGGVQRWDRELSAG